MVRRLEPHRARRRQQGARASPPDRQLRHRAGICREEPDPGHPAQPPSQAHPLPVARGDRPPASGARRPVPESGPPAGGHHPASSADRMPQGRDRRAPMVGGRGGRPDAGRFQDRGRGGCRSTARRGVSSNVSLGKRARSCFPRRAIRRGRAVPSSGCGARSERKRASRTCGFTISAIRMPATR